MFDKTDSWTFLVSLFGVILMCGTSGCRTKDKHTKASYTSVWNADGNCWGSLCRSNRPKPFKRPKAPKLRVLSFNVNYGGHPAKALARIHASKADVVALQETTPAWERWLRPRLRKKYHVIKFFHSPGAGGMGFLSIYPLKSSKRLSPPKDGWFDAWKLVVKTPLGQIAFLNVHLRPPLGSHGRLSSIPKAYFTTPGIRKRELQHHMRAMPKGTPLIVLGDFNEGRQSPGIRWLRKSQKLKSALHKFDKTTPTWYWPTRFWTFRARLDHILYSKHLKPISARVMADGGSDHFPLLAIFQKR